MGNIQALVDCHQEGSQPLLGELLAFHCNACPEVMMQTY